MAFYRKKPVTIEAIQWTGDNYNEIRRFAKIVAQNRDANNSFLIIRTLEGDMRADIGDYIIKGVDGEFYPCKPDIFRKTYDKVEE